MPSIAHFVMGGIIGICLYYISDRKFTKTHVFIFFLSNYLGPDIGWVFGIGHFTHSLIFWPLFAVILTFFYHYFTRFTIKIDGIKNIEIIDLEGYKLHYFNTYLLVLAAGILHNYLDGMLNKEGEFRIIPQLSLNSEEKYWTLNDFNVFGKESMIQFHFLFAIIIGVALIFGFVFIYVWFLKKNSKQNAMIVFFYVIGFLVFFYLVGNMATMFHPDGGAIIYISIFWGSPLILCALSTKEFKFIKRGENGLIKPWRESANKRFSKRYLIIAWFFFTGLLLMLASIYYLAYSKAILRRIFSNYGDEISQYFSYNEVYVLIITIGIFNLVLSLINFICVLGLLFKNRGVWKFAVYYNLLLSWTIIGLTIACALSENSFKETFKKKAELRNTN